MRSAASRLVFAAALVGVSSLIISDASAQVEKPSRARLARSTRPKSVQPAAELAETDLLAALRAGALSVNAEAAEPGVMNLTVTNNTPRRLKVVLPPGLVASGATGQFGGMGGAGGGMNGMGGGQGGGMNGMGGGGGAGGMNGMGGGGQGGGMNGMGGMRGGSQVVPAPMGMLMLSRVIMALVGDRSSWNQASLMIGMGGGGGAGGLNMGGRGGIGGGFRSVAPTGLPFAVLEPGQTRVLPTRLVSLGAPTKNAHVLFPTAGEKLALGEVDQASSNPRLQAALKRLAEEKAPTVAAQLVLWNVGLGIDWPTVARLSNAWADPYQVTLARRFVDRLDASASTGRAGRLFVEIKGDKALGDELTRLLKDGPVLGLRPAVGVPASPGGPAVACMIRVVAGKQAEVEVLASDGRGESWVSAGKFNVPLIAKDGGRDVAGFADAVAAGMLEKLVVATLEPGKKVKGKDTYILRVDNESPLILNGFALGGSDLGGSKKTIQGLCLTPHGKLAVAVSPEAVEGLGLKQGVRIQAVDLSEL